MPSLREQQKADTRLRLLAAAEAVFARRGFHGASVDEIAREAGATTGALYANFAGKEDRFLQLFDHAIARAAARGLELEPVQVERLGTFVNALANGLALEKLVDPAAVPDELLGDLLVLVFDGFDRSRA